MEDKERERAILNVPAAAPAHYSTNFIRHAVCELRFPTLFDLEASSPPKDFARLLRKDYPTYQQLNDFALNPGSVAHGIAHAFRSKKNTWTVILRPFAISLETAHYDSFAEFAKRIERVLQAARKVIDSDFYTRVGLRYVNALPYERATVATWVNPLLVGALASGVFGDVDDHLQRITGVTDVGGYNFVHGIVKSEGRLDYSLDFDFFGEDVAVDDALEVIGTLHRHEFSLFSWALGDKARSTLGPSDIKEER